MKIGQFRKGKSIKFDVNLTASLFIIFPFPVLGIIVISLPSSRNEFISLIAQTSDFPKGKEDVINTIFLFIFLITSSPSSIKCNR